MIPRPLLAKLALLLLLTLFTSVSCAGPGADGGGPLPFKVAVIPCDVTVLPGPAGATDDADCLPTQFDPELVTAALRTALGAQFADVVVLPSPAGVALEEFRRTSKREQDLHWIRACAEAHADLVLECDVKLPGRARSSHNEEFWLNLPLFLLGGPFCYFVSDTSYEGEGRLVATLHQVLPIQEGAATLANRRAEVARFDVRVDGVRLDFLDRAEPISYAESLVVPPGFLARDTARVRARFAELVGQGLASGLAHQVGEASQAILKTDDLADFYLMRNATAVAVGREIRVEGEVVIRGEIGDMRELALICGSHRVTGTLEPARRDPLLSTDRETVMHARFSERVPQEEGVDRVRVELVQGGREQIARTFTIPVTVDLVAGR
jgi:hypothetical protein